MKVGGIWVLGLVLFSWLLE